MVFDKTNVEKMALRGVLKRFAAFYDGLRFIFWKFDHLPLDVVFSTIALSTFSAKIATFD